MENDPQSERPRPGWEKETYQQQPLGLLSINILDLECLWWRDSINAVMTIMVITCRVGSKDGGSNYMYC